MSRFKNEITHLQAHIKTLRLGAGALVIVALVMGGGWWSAHCPGWPRSPLARSYWKAPVSRESIRALPLRGRS